MPRLWRTHGAAVVVEETKLEGVWLAETIAALLQDPRRLQADERGGARTVASERGARHCGDGGAGGGN